MKGYCICLFVLGISYNALADTYLQFPRGSNNRLEEKSANRQNGNRVFDSQNNNRGGYNVGDKTDKAFGDTVSKQYHMTHFQSSQKGKTWMNIEWTNQHGCGGDEDKDPHKLNCNIVLQYRCQPDKAFSAASRDKLRNGVNTQTQKFTRTGNRAETRGQAINRKNRDIHISKVYQDTWEWYDDCRTRGRNKGLFTADQKLKGNEAIYTRQNPNGNRRGYECPEERDHYPYWHPTEWKDIAVLAENATRCRFYKKHSFNVKSKFRCVQKDGSLIRHSSKHNNEKDCKDDGGEFLEFVNYLEEAPQYKTEPDCIDKNGVKYIWGRPLNSLLLTGNNIKKRCLVKLDAPDCYNALWSRSNHLGNGVDGQPLSHKWALPHFPSGDIQRCVVRIRYNISTDDYDPVTTDSKFNQDKAQGVFSPVQNNPAVNIGAGNTPLQLAINTAQFGRTFQDRSHFFFLEQRPKVDGIKADTVIHNVNVRGKRGNIVQTYPATEYDFTPNDLKMKADDLIHFQWTGSNTHNNGNPAGDGQAGDAGEGTGGTDRHNVCEIKDRNDNYCLPLENSKMFSNAKVMWTSDPNMRVNAEGKPKTSYTGEDIAVAHASAGYYSCVKSATCGSSSVQSKAQMNNLLNNAPASYKGMMLKLVKDWDIQQDPASKKRQAKRLSKKNKKKATVA